MPTPNAHALLSASGAHRWLACTAAPHFEAQFPPGPPSPYAEEGTLAHSVCELYARKYFTSELTKRKFNSELKKLQSNDLYSDEMLHTAEAYVEHLKEWAMKYTDTPHVVQEVRVDFSAYVPGGFGTCDCVMIGGSHLHITDYKHGKGVPVSAQGNPQMRLYALGALQRYGVFYEIKTVSMSICQPRLSDEPNEDTLSVEELLAWGESIKPAAAEAYNGPGTFCPGEHCRFCRGKAQCRARAEMNTALEDFKNCIPAGAVPEDQRNIPAEARAVLSLPPVLSDAEIGELLERGKSLVQWYTDLQEYATQTLLSGIPVPGWKVVEGRSNRAFKDVDAALDALVEAGYDKAVLYDYKPKTLTELEKVVGKKVFGELMAGHIVKPQGKPTLAPETDKRPAYSSAAADFAGATNG